jgi:hypothetical protein
VATIRISDENYAYLLGVAARIQVEESKPKSPNDALDWVIQCVKKYRDGLSNVPKPTKGENE